MITDQQYLEHAQAIWDTERRISTTDRITYNTRNTLTGEPGKPWGELNP